MSANAAALDLGDYSVTVEQGAAWPAGTDWGIGPSQSDVLAAPFGGQSIYYVGRNTGGPSETLNGAYLIHRTRIEFDALVDLDGVNFSAAGHHDNQAQARLLDETLSEIASVPLTGYNVFGNFSIVNANAVGKVFYLEEYDYSTDYRYRDDYLFDYTFHSLPEAGAIVPVAASTLIALGAIQRRRNSSSASRRCRSVEG